MGQRPREMGTEALQRMLSYLREEALRLRVMDVALLLDQAEQAVTAFAPAALAVRGRAPALPGADRVEH